eukprot:TRINITY_DN825_c0_g1_i2.p1 TRINITY_DN825_c0_g1~~TRINITY_DN825_c0_g1_i2.p1  ORF type:complete len:338 (+),score=108.90 TRINITY_DN825_c0_g1_i2:151-1014(+)
MDPRGVFVTNISPSANEKTVSDFFSFCGRIVNLTLRKSSGSTDGAQEATVVFETDSAAKTALLLTNALIVDRPINVVPFTPTEEATAPVVSDLKEDDTPHPEITQRNFTVPDSERTKTSVVASLMAAGYVLGSDAFAKAKEVDEKHMISLQLKVGAESIKAKANEIDAKFGISDTATAIKTAAVEKAHEIDEKLGISDKATVAATIAKGAASTVVDKVNSNETFAKGISAIKSATNTVAASLNEVKEETKRAIDEKKAERGDHPASVTTTTTTTTSVATPSAPPQST